MYFSVGLSVFICHCVSLLFCLCPCLYLCISDFLSLPVSLSLPFLFFPPPLSLYQSFYLSLYLCLSVWMHVSVWTGWDEKSSIIELQNNFCLARLIGHWVPVTFSLHVRDSLMIDCQMYFFSYGELNTGPSLGVILTLSTELHTQPDCRWFKHFSLWNPRGRVEALLDSLVREL